MKKYKFDPEAYKTRLKREKDRPELKERFKHYDKVIAKHPSFDSEEEALNFAVPKVKKLESLSVWQAPKELGGKWKVLNPEENAPDAADQLGWCMIYDFEKLLSLADESIDEIEEV